MRPPPRNTAVIITVGMSNYSFIKYRTKYNNIMELLGHAFGKVVNF